MTIELQCVSTLAAQVTEQVYNRLILTERFLIHEYAANGIEYPYMEDIATDEDIAMSRRKGKELYRQIRNKYIRALAGNLSLYYSAKNDNWCIDIEFTGLSSITILLNTEAEAEKLYEILDNYLFNDKTV